jgi:hypothetical protein
MAIPARIKRQKPAIDREETAALDLQRLAELTRPCQQRLP